MGELPDRMRAVTHQLHARFKLPKSRSRSAPRVTTWDCHFRIFYRHYLFFDPIYSGFHIGEVENFSPLRCLRGWDYSVADPIKKETCYM
jgi:hypothetical protein